MVGKRFLILAFVWSLLQNCTNGIASSKLMSEGSANKDEVEENFDAVESPDFAAPQPRYSPLQGSRVTSRQFNVPEVCLGVQCYPDQTCEAYEYYGTSYPICYNSQHYAFDSCNGDVCQHGGVCVGNTVCQCPDNTHGLRCETTFTPCQDRTTCPSASEICVTVSGGGHRCLEAQPPTVPAVMPPTFAGVCDNNDCVGRGCECVPSCMHENGYYCKSAFGYIGEQCNIGPPEVICGQSEISVEIPVQFVQEFTRGNFNAYMYVSPTVDTYATVRGCQVPMVANDGKYIVRLTAPYNACGTEEVQGSDGVMVYRNAIWINRQTTFAYDIPHPVVRFNCTYDRNYEVIGSIRPLVDNTIASLNGSMQGEISVELCKVSTCTSSCPSDLVVNGAAYYTIGQRIHLSTYLTMPFTAGSYSTVIQEAFLSCDNTQPDPSSALVLTRECNKGTQFAAMFDQRQGSSNSNCGSFRVPRMSGCPLMFYIHLRVIVCPSFTTKYCDDGSTYKVCRDGLSKRSIDDESNVSHHVIGPVMVYAMARSGYPTVALGANNDTFQLVLNDEVDYPVSYKPAQPKGYLVLVASLVVSAVLVILAIILIVVIRFHRRSVSFEK